MCILHHNGLEAHVTPNVATTRPEWNPLQLRPHCPPPREWQRTGGLISQIEQCCSQAMLSASVLSATGPFPSDQAFTLPAVETSWSRHQPQTGTTHRQNSCGSASRQLLVHVCVRHRNATENQLLAQKVKWHRAPAAQSVLRHQASPNQPLCYSPVPEEHAQ